MFDNILLPKKIVTTDFELPSDVVEALEKGRKIEAIQLLRSHRNLNLKDAKSAVDAYISKTSALVSRSSLSDEDDLPDDVLAEIRAGNRVKAIKLLHQHRNTGLKEAQKIVDARIADVRIASDRIVKARERSNPHPDNSRNWLGAIVVAVVVTSIAAVTLLGAVPDICIVGLGSGCTEDARE